MKITTRITNSPPMHTLSEGERGMLTTLTGRRCLVLAAGALALAGFALALTPSAPAQAKKAAKTEAKAKAEPKEEDANTDTKADEKKAEEKGPEIKVGKVVDAMDPRFGGVEQVTYINEAIEKG